MTAEAVAAIRIARVNDIALHTPEENLDFGELHQRACVELLRQAAQSAGLLGANDVAPVNGVISEDASTAIDALLEQHLHVPQPSEDACRRYYAAHQAAYRIGERAWLRHILFAVTPGVEVVALRKQAESTLVEVRSHEGNASSRFSEVARMFSNCPSGADGGDLGWLSVADCAPEIAREIFGRIEVGVLPRLVHSRFGLHVIEVLQREPGVVQPFESVRGAVAHALHQQAFVTALRQYLRVLAGAAIVEGVKLEATGTPLVQ